MLEISFSRSGALTIIYLNNNKKEVKHKTLNESIVKVVYEIVRSYGPFRYTST